jgi:hypothetical protein
MVHHFTNIEHLAYNRDHRHMLVSAGEVHRRVPNYSGLRHIPICVSVMRGGFQPRRHEMVKVETRAGKERKKGR